MEVLTCVFDGMNEAGQADAHLGVYVLDHHGGMPHPLLHFRDAPHEVEMLEMATVLEDLRAPTP